jgi:alpha-tubulin suppressor-like RCC1 family protein
VYTWGRNHVGQLGDGTFSNKNEPVRIDKNFGNNVQLRAKNHNLLITSNGKLYGWYILM